MTDLAPGMRAVIRYAHPVDGLSDALGEVVLVEPSRIRIRTRRGEVDIDPGAIQLAHEVPPAPQRSGPAHRSISADDLQRVLASTWLARETAWLHRDNAVAEASGSDPQRHQGWLLRAHGGITKRANSALLSGPTELPHDEAITALEAWYAERGQRAAASLHSTDPDSPPGPSEADEAFAARGYEIVAPVTIATAAAAEVSGGATAVSRIGDERLRVESSAVLPEPMAEVLCANDDSEGREARMALLSSAPDTVHLGAFGIHPDGSRTLVGVARLAISQRWAVLSHVTVRDDLRRRGAGTALTRAAAAHALGRGIQAIALQVEDANTGAATMYAGLGFRPHHRQHYRIR